MAVQVMVNATVAVAPVATVAVLVVLSAVQFAEMFESATVCVPAGVFGSSTWPFTPMGCGCSPSTANLYPSASGSGPLVDVVIRRVPVDGGMAVQVTVKLT